MPEKYAYGLDRKGQGDLAYAQLDIEQGDDNELSRAQAEFYEQYYLQEKEPKMMRDLERANNIVKAYKKPPMTDGGKALVQSAKDKKTNIEVERIPEILGKTPTAISGDTSHDLYSSLIRQTNRPLTAPEVNKINNILTQMNAF